MPVVPSSLQSWEFLARTILDDGAVFYLNGQEGRRVRMPTGPVTWSTLASGNGGNFRFDASPYALPTTNVAFGAANLLAVEVHQSDLTSSDVGFATELLVNVPALEMRITTAINVNGQVVLTWPPAAGYKLYECDNVEGPYTTPVAGNPIGSYTVPPPLAAKKFYRLGP